MSRIRSKDTKPEMLVRRLLFTEGYRYRLYAGDQDTVAQSLRGFLGPPGPPP